ncbi:hypothetical protein [Psychrobacillus psychrodurans]|nr:hypothetical protein [Psychrobacillus psychrodurans]MCZ8541518.1 hypothetical protein [Psychrobacillus psychrodurans]
MNISWNPVININARKNTITNAMTRNFCLTDYNLEKPSLITYLLVD